MSFGNRLVGVHCSTAGGLYKAVTRGEKLGCTVIQLFTKNNNRFLTPPLSLSDIDAFCAALTTSHIRLVVAHAGYLLNLATPDPVLTERSMESMRLELQNAHAVGIPYLIVHPGAHKGEGETTAVRRIAERLNILLDETGGDPTSILIEGTAGQGTTVGHRFEHLRDILDGVRFGDRIGVCLDTAHLFAAGFDLRTPRKYKETWKSFDRIVGRQWLKAIHLNDTKRELGSRVDRHEQIGKGKIGRAGFRLIMKDKSLKAIPMVLETPKGKTDAMDMKNLSAVRELMR